MGDAADADTDTATAMAAAMGFSSFGAQKPNKRRRFNSSTDAVVAPAESSISTLPFHRYNHHHDYSHNGTTGSNAIPLGVRRQNVDEIDLDDHDDLQHLPPSHQAAQLTTAGGDDPEPQYLDTSRPPVPVTVEPADILQSRIDAIVGVPADAYSSSQPPPSSAVGAGHFNRGGRGGRQQTMNRGNRSGTRWWEDYYDPEVSLLSAGLVSPIIYILAFQLLPNFGLACTQLDAEESMSRGLPIDLYPRSPHRDPYWTFHVLHYHSTQPANRELHYSLGHCGIT